MKLLLFLAIYKHEKVDIVAITGITELQIVHQTETELEHPRYTGPDYIYVEYSYS